MEIVYLLVPLAMLLVGVVIWALLWSIRNGQFDDLQGPAHRILMDDDPANDPLVRSTPALRGMASANIDVSQRTQPLDQKK